MPNPHLRVQSDLMPPLSDGTVSLSLTPKMTLSLASDLHPTMSLMMNMTLSLIPDMILSSPLTLCMPLALPPLPPIRTGSGQT